MKKKTLLPLALLAIVVSMIISSYTQGGEPATPGKPAEITIDPGKTALLLLHWQNDLVKPEGKVSGPLPGQLAAARTIEHTQAVLKASREKKMLIIYVAASQRPGYPEFPEKPGPLAAAMVKAQAFLRGTWGAEIIDDLKPLKDEIVVTNYSPSGFTYTELDLLLRNRGITGVVLTGLVTNWVVETTGRDALSRGYFVYTLADCCNSWSEESHKWSLTNILPMLGAVSDSKSYVEALEKAK
jgi:nicotinamidase-related amidase